MKPRIFTDKIIIALDILQRTQLEATGRPSTSIGSLSSIERYRTERKVALRATSRPQTSAAKSVTVQRTSYSGDKRTKISQWVTLFIFVLHMALFLLLYYGNNSSPHTYHGAEKPHLGNICINT